MEQGDPRAPVGVVLDRGDLGRDVVLVAAEVDDAVAALGAASLVPGGDPAVHVAPGFLPSLRQQRLLGRRPRDLVERGDARAASARRRRLVFANGHGYVLPPSKI